MKKGNGAQEVDKGVDLQNFQEKATCRSTGIGG